MTTEIDEEPVCRAPVALIVRLVTAETADVCVVNDEAVTLPTFAEIETVESPDTSCPFSDGTSFSATPDTVEETPLGTPDALAVRAETPDAVEETALGTPDALAVRAETPDAVEDTPRAPEPLLVRSAVLTTRLDCASREPFAVGKRLHRY